MRLSELAEHVNNLRELTAYLSSQIRECDKEVIKLNEEGIWFLKQGLSKESNEIKMITRKITETQHKASLFKGYKRSITAIMSLEARIPTNL